jgi:ABC-type transport system substrate-binding protein
MAIAVKPVPEPLQLQAYHDAQRVMYAEVPGLPLYSPLWVRGIRSGIGGYRLHSAEQEYWEVLELNR